MAIVQSTYSENMAIATNGMLADCDNSVDARVCETAAGIGFGVAVSQGSADNGALIAAAAATDFVGVSVQDKTVSSDTYAQYDNMGVVTRGSIWVTVPAAVNAGDNVTFNSTTGALSSIAADGSNFAVAGAVWKTSAAISGLAKLYLSGEMPSA